MTVQNSITEPPVIIGNEAYVSPAYAAAEGERLWPKVWQVACREEEIPNVGDYVTYDILDDSIIVVRAAPDRIAAYFNVCRHRGRQLTEGCGHAKKFVCPFHAWSWNLDGSNSGVVRKDAWGDSLNPDDLRLRDVRADTWGGWVFLCMDPDAPSLREYLEPAATAGSKVKGVEFDFNYRTLLDGLSLNGAASYNDAKYSSFPDVQCYNGQTAAMGCILRPIAADPSVLAYQQDLGGQVLPRAPKWSLAGGFNYETPLLDAWKIGLSGGVNYTSSYDTDVTANPYSRQSKYAIVDATIRLGEANDRWELALIGRNLTNKWYIAATTDVPFTGGAAGSGLLGDRFASVSRGREIMLRASVKFGR